MNHAHQHPPINWKVEYGLRENRTSWKPLEDALWVHDRLPACVVADGVTRDLVDGTYPDPSPAAEVARQFVDELSARIVRQMHTQGHCLAVDLKAMFVAANHAIWKRNQHHPDYFFPGTVATAVVLNGRRWVYAYIGDVLGLHRPRGEAARRFTERQTEAVRQQASSFSKAYIRQQLCNQPGHAYGYGVLNGQQGAKAFIRTGHFPAVEGDQLLVASDGLEPLLEKDPDAVWGPSLEAALDQTETIERAENLRSDDKAVVRIRWPKA